jgi:hypothetical protein
MKKTEGTKETGTMTESRVRPNIREMAKTNVLIAYNVATTDHEDETGHRVYETFWWSKCQDCDWKRTLTCTGDPFNPNGHGEFQLWES